MPALGMKGRVGGGSARFAPREKAKNAKGTFLRLLKLYCEGNKAVLSDFGVFAHQHGDECVRALLYRKKRQRCEQRRRGEHRQQEESGRLNGLLEESIDGGKMVRAFNMRDAAYIFIIILAMEK